MNNKIAQNTIAALDEYIKRSLVFLEDGERTATRKWIWEGIFKMPTFEIAWKGQEKLSESEILKIHFALKEVQLGKPIQYVVGEVPFLNVVLKVNPSVLIPRPETEELVSKILAKCNNVNSRVLDIGTGSGCIAIAIAKSRTQWTVEGWELSEPALEVAHFNNTFNATQAIFKKMDILEKHTASQEQWDVIVSNPPYIPFSEAEGMDAQVLNHEPHLALFTPTEEPLLYYKSIRSFVQSHLAHGGWVALEVHYRWAEDVAALWKDASEWEVQIDQDMQGKKRFVFAKRIATS